jgi:tRNA 2-thiouridine synthesizing protein A
MNTNEYFPGLIPAAPFGVLPQLSDNAGLFLERPMSDSTEHLTVDAVLDATGLNCPEPVMMLHQKVRDLAPGGLLKVIATDPSTRRDIPKFCVFLGHELVDKQVGDAEFLYWIRKKLD